MAYAVLWHNTGSAKLKLPLFDAVYERNLGKEKLPIEKLGDSMVIEISDSAYLSANVSVEELKSALRKATVI